MTPLANLSRRSILQGSAFLPLATGMTFANGSLDAEAAAGQRPVLVAYLTRTGNTRVIARQIRRALDADLFEIETAEPYPEEYDAMVAQAERERQTGFEPELAALVPSIGGYQTMFLGFPIWGMTAPAPIRSFLSKHALAGKTLVPFITHGGYGLGSSLNVVAEHAPATRLVEGFSMEADQERRTRDQVKGWLDNVDVPR